MANLLQTPEVIPLDAVILRSAADVEIIYGLSGQDAIIPKFAPGLAAGNAAKYLNSLLG
jgi:hypothetical protein